MTFTRIVTALGIALLAAFAIVVIAEGQAGAGAAVVAFIAIAALVGAGNALYGRHSHGKKALDRVRSAQEAQNRAADVAAEARRAVAEADRRGERYCPLDPAHRQPHPQPHAAAEQPHAAAEQPHAAADT